MSGVKIFLTGPPGSGKSTAFMRSVELLRGLGFTVGGIATPEIRSQGRREGFSVVDLATGRKGLLAGVDTPSNFRVGKYGVDVPGFESVALRALCYAVESCDVVCIDEIGRMELFSKPFERKIEEVIRGPKPMISVLHHNYVGTYSRWGKLFNVSKENREDLPQLVVSCLKEYLKNEGREDPKRS